MNETASVVSLTSTGDKFVYTPSTPVEVVRVGFVSTIAPGGAPVIAFDKRPTAGSDTNRVNAAFGTITPGALAAGQMAYHEPDPLTESRILNPGEQLVAEVTTASSTTGTGYFTLTVRDLGFAEGPETSIANATEFAS